MTTPVSTRTYVETPCRMARAVRKKAYERSGSRLCSRLYPALYKAEDRQVRAHCIQARQCSESRVSRPIFRSTGPNASKKRLAFILARSGCRNERQQRPLLFSRCQHFLRCTNLTQVSKFNQLWMPSSCALRMASYALSLVPFIWLSEIQRRSRQARLS
jgi:hypothetical protein